MNKRLQELRDYQLSLPIEVFIEEIKETIGYIELDGYSVTNIAEAVDKFNGDITELESAYNSYYDGMYIKYEYTPIQGYLHCIGSCIGLIEKKLNLQNGIQ